MDRRWTCVVSLFLCAPFLLAMGLLGEPPARETVPETKEKVEAVLVDLEGVSTSVDSFSYDGDLYLPAYRGRAMIIIPFEKIVSVQFGETQKNRRQARVLLRSQEEEELSVDEKVSFVGRVPYGTFQIQVKDLKSIRLTQGSSE